MSLRKKGITILVFAFFCALFFFIGNYNGRHELQAEIARNQSLNQQLQSEINRNLLLKCGLQDIYGDLKDSPGNAADSCNVLKVKSAVQDIYLNLKYCNNWADSVNEMAQWLYRQFSPSNLSNPKIACVERKQAWAEVLSEINSELFSCSDWFDTVKVLSVWLYQNTRVGNPKLDIDKTFGKENLNKWYTAIGKKDVEWFYNVNSSDSVVSNCGSHCYFATRLYEHFNIKSYHLSISGNLKESEEGHMINVLFNPHDRKWYPVDHFFGIRWKHDGKWLDMETYLRLSKIDIKAIDVEPFATFKFHIYESPFTLFNSWSLETIEIAECEVSNYKNHFRIVAPYTLRKRFPAHQALFDSIAATHNQSPHRDWLDLARRMPMYGAILFSPPPLKEQHHADSLLTEWRKQFSY